MIFGMPEHKPEEWSRDLTELISLGIGHLSLYNLTYEKRTPLTKFLEKGRFVPLNEDAEAELYAQARDLLGNYKYIHEEVSNWALTSKSCRHNWLYWQDYPYLGVGAAAHSYLPNSETQGIRFSYPQSVAAFIKSTPKTISGLLANMILECGSTVDERDLEAWVLETVSCSLRTNRGVDTAYIYSKTSLQFKPTPLVSQALANGSLFWRGRHIVLDVGQWFCESSWSLAVASSFSF
jgi:oxygen-independent coproporphyrinogen-3 oxidase